MLRRIDHIASNDFLTRSACSGVMIGLLQSSQPGSQTNPRVTHKCFDRECLHVTLTVPPRAIPAIVIPDGGGEILSLGAISNDQPARSDVETAGESGSHAVGGVE